VYNSSIVVCIRCHGNVFNEFLPSNNGEIHIQMHKESRLKTDKLLDVVFSPWSHVFLHGILTAISSGSTIPAFRKWGEHTDSKR
jgi:hypothetical protein